MKTRTIDGVDDLETSADGIVPAVLCPLPQYGGFCEYAVAGELDVIRVSELAELGGDDDATTRRMSILSSSWGEPRGGGLGEMPTARKPPSCVEGDRQGVPGARQAARTVGKLVASSATRGSRPPKLSWVCIEYPLPTGRRRLWRCSLGAALL